MSIAPPPYPIFNNIDYNSSFFSANTGGLTQGQANTLYLQKTKPDTAGVLETFTAGINTNIIQPASTGANLFLYTISSYALNFATNAFSLAIGTSTALISIGGTSTITNFVGQVTSAYTLLASDSSTNVATTNWITSNFGKLSAANFWTAVNTFTAGLNTASIGNISLASAYYLWNTANNTVNIATATTQTLNVGSNTGTTNLQGITLQVGTATTGTTNIVSQNTNIGTTGSFVNFNSPLSTSYTPSTIVLGQIGYSTSGVLITTSTPANSAVSLMRITLNPGVYILIGGFTAQQNSTGYNFLSFGSNLNNLLPYVGNQSNVVGSTLYSLNLNCQAIYSTNSTVNVYLNAQTLTANINVNPNLTVVKIA